MAIPLHLRLGICQSNTAVGMVIVNGIFRILGQLFIQINRMRLKPHHSLVHAEICHLRRRMPGRATGQLIAFDQNDVVPAFLSEMVERRTASDSAADNHNFGTGFH